MSELRPLFPDWASPSSSSNPSTPSNSSNIPPPEWTSDEQMDALFGPLDANSGNPIVQRTRERKLQFWQQLILNAFSNDPYLSSRDPVISYSILKTLLLRKGLYPMGISSIIQHLVDNKLLVPVEDFVNSQNSNSWSSWIIGSISSFMKRSISPSSLSTSARQTSNSSIETTDTKYLLIPALEDHANRILSQLKSKTGIGSNLFALDDISSLLQGHSIELLLPKMPNVRLFDVKGIKAIKVGTNPTNAVVTDADRSLFHLSRAIQHLDEKDHKLSEEIKRLRSETSKSLKDGFRQKAAHFLRRSKLLQKNLDQLLQARENLLRIFLSIEEAHTSSEIINAMKEGSIALEAYNTKIGGVEKVDALVDTVSELISQQDEISDALANTPIDTNPLTQEDEMKLEQELADLIASNLSTPATPATSSSSIETDKIKSPNASQSVSSTQKDRHQDETRLSEEESTRMLLEELQLINVPAALSQSKTPSQDENSKPKQLELVDA